MNLLLMADKNVGLEIAQWLFREFPEDVVFVLVASENDIWEEARRANIPCAVFESSRQADALINKVGVQIDIGILAWWPTLIREPLISKPRFGFVNTHPSLLPYNRGKHYNFWALVEETPFGVSLHMIDDGVDSGDVIAQKRLDYSWEDNGESLYFAAQEAMVQLFKDTYPDIHSLDFPRKSQELKHGSFHKASELDPASEIKLNQSYVARDLLNLLRARTFPGHPACWFKDGNDKFEVRVEIKRKNDGSL